MSVKNLPTSTGIPIGQGQTPKNVEKTKITDDRQYIPKQFKDVAAGMEQQFAEVMLEQMNQTIGEEASEGSAGMDYYKSLLNSERAKAMTNQNNLGLQDMVLDQIYPKRMRNEMALKQYEAQANRIHQNLPSYKLERNTDTIEMGKNDSTSKSDQNTLVRQNEEGGLP